MIRRTKNKHDPPPKTHTKLCCLFQIPAQVAIYNLSLIDCESFKEVEAQVSAKFLSRNPNSERPSRKDIELALGKSGIKTKYMRDRIFNDDLWNVNWNQFTLDYQVQDEDPVLNPEVSPWSAPSFVSENFVSSFVDRRNLDSVVQSLQETLGNQFVLKVFGSFCFDLKTFGSDIDALVESKSGTDFDATYDSLVKILSNSIDVTNLNAVRNAGTPVVNLDFKTIAFDLVVAVSGDDPLSLKSRTGFELTQFVMRSVDNFVLFRSVLRVVRLWAWKRSISKGSYGYINGIGWAVLVAKVCQMFPEVTELNQQLANFFNTFSAWDWKRAVVLRDSPLVDLRDNSVMKVVILESNVTSNVNKGSLKRIIAEFKRGALQTDAVMLCERYIFPDLHPNIAFLQLCVSANRLDTVSWFSAVESKMYLFSKHFCPIACKFTRGNRMDLYVHLSSIQDVKVTLKTFLGKLQRDKKKDPDRVIEVFFTCFPPMQQAGNLLTALPLTTASLTAPPKRKREVPHDQVDDCSDQDTRSVRQKRL
jgi:predicted nucleotidyltransferase